MDRSELRKKVASKIFEIRAQYRNSKGRVMTQVEFTDLLNKAEPLEIQFETITYGSWERGDRNCPSDKYEKILGMDKGGENV